MLATTLTLPRSREPLDWLCCALTMLLCLWASGHTLPSCSSRSVTSTGEFASPNNPRRHVLCTSLPWFSFVAECFRRVRWREDPNHDRCHDKKEDDAPGIDEPSVSAWSSGWRLRAFPSLIFPCYRSVLLNVSAAGVGANLSGKGVRCWQYVARIRHYSMWVGILFDVILPMSWLVQATSSSLCS